MFRLRFLSNQPLHRFNPLDQSHLDSLNSRRHMIHLAPDLPTKLAFQILDTLFQLLTQDLVLLLQLQVNLQYGLLYTRILGCFNSL